MEAVFLNTYGSPVLQALVGLSAQEAESLRRIERDVLREVAEAELRLTQLSYRYASDSRNAPENCGLLRPLSICGAKNHCPFRGHLALTGSTLMCWRRCSRNAVRTVGRRKSRLDHRFSLGALQSELPPPWHVWCLNRSAPHNALISSHIFSSGGKVGFEIKGLVRGRRASGRGDARHHLCPPARGPCRRTRLAMLKLIRASRPASKRLSLIRFKEVVKDQFLLVSLDQDALPKLLPADETGRQDALMRSSASYQPLDLYPRTRNLALRA